MFNTYIPFEIQVEIIRRLPIKSLIRFRTISKPWKSLMDSSQFITDYNNVHQTRQRQRLLIRYASVETYYPYNHVCIVDDETFPQHTAIYPVEDSSVIGSSHGLLALFCYCSEDDNVVIWNPSIRKTVSIHVPILYNKTLVGFGVCPRTLNPKIVKIPHYVAKKRGRDKKVNCDPLGIEVFSLSSGTWTSPRCNLPRESIKFKRSQVVIAGFIYWYGFDLIPFDLITEVTYNLHEVNYNLIMSFDLTNEEFIEIYLPYSLAHHPSHNLSISKLRESLVVLEYDYDDHEDQFCSLWIMEHGIGAPNSFTKMYTIKAPVPWIITILGFRTSGAPIMEMQDINDVDDNSIPSKLAVYDPHLEHFSEIGILGRKDSFVLHSYMETLLLIDRSAK